MCQTSRPRASFNKSPTHKEYHPKETDDLFPSSEP